MGTKESQVRSGRRRVLSVVLTVALAFGMAACGGNEAPGSGASIKVGVVLSFGGPLAAGSLQELEGIKYYVNQLNQAGGIDGRQIELVQRDDNSEPATGIQQFRDLVNDPGIVGVVGPAGSGVTAAVKPVAEQSQVPLVSSVAAGALSDPPTHWWFRSYVPDTLQTQALLTVAAKSGKTAVIVYPDDAFGQSGAASFKKLAPAAGVSIIGEVTIPANATDPRIEIIKAKSYNPDLYIFWDGSNVARLAQEVKVAREQGITSNMLILPQPAGQDAFVTAAGAAANGCVYFGQMATDAPLPGAQTAFANGYKASTGKVPDESVLLGYAAIDILGEGIKQAAKKGEVTRSSLRDAIEAISGFDSALGTVGFSATNHNPVVLKDVGVNTIKDGKRVRVEG